jgi:ABC-type amino acid transport substrate-binding protein
MKFKWIAIAAAGLALGLAAVAAQPAEARAKKKIARTCVDRPQAFSFLGIITNPAPQPNGCAPPVYQYGRYVGQDPDPFIRQQLLRDPQTGYTQY